MISGLFYYMVTIFNIIFPFHILLARFSDINIRYTYSIFYLPVMDLSYLFLFYRKSILSGILVFYFLHQYDFY